MAEQKKAMKVTVLPAGHPLLRNLSSDQQIVIRQQQPGAATQQLQTAPQQVFSIRQPSVNRNCQQIIIRQQGAAQQPQNQPLVIRQQASGQGTQPLIIRSQANGQIRLTPAQLSSLTNQQFIIRQPQQNQQQHQQTPSRLTQQQIIIRPQQVQTTIPSQRPQLLSSQYVQQPPRTYSNSISTVGKFPQHQQPVVTYLKQNPLFSESKDVSSANSIVKNTHVIQNIKLSSGGQTQPLQLSNIRFSVANNSSATTNNMILSSGSTSTDSSTTIGSTNMVRLDARSLGKRPASTSTSYPSLSEVTSFPDKSTFDLPSSLSNHSLEDTSLCFENNQVPVNSSNLTIQRHKPNVIRNLSGIKQIAPKSVSNTGSSNKIHQNIIHAGSLQSSPPEASLATTMPTNNIIMNTKQNPQQISLLTPNRNIQPKTQVQFETSNKIEGLQLITADGKFIDTEGLHLLSPNGTVLKAENLLQNISLKQQSKKTEFNTNNSISELHSPTRKKNTSPALNPSFGRELNAQQLLSSIKQPPNPLRQMNAEQLISNIQQPVPLEASLSMASLTVTPPPKVLQTTILQPNILSSPPIQQPTIQAKSPKNKVQKELKDIAKTAVNPQNVLKNNLVPPLAVLPLPSSILPQNAQTMIQSMLPTQPLLPSQIKGLTPVARPLNFTPKPAQKPRAKTKKESMRAKIQKLESNLNVQHLLGLIDKKYSTNNRVSCSESDMEGEFLTSIEKESRGEFSSKQSISLQDNFYKECKVNRYIQMNLTYDSDTDNDDCVADDAYIINMLKKHVKNKKRKLQLMNNENDEDLNSSNPMDIKKFSKGRGRGRPSKSAKGNTIDSHNMGRHRLWISIMKKEVAKGGKARNYNSKEKIANAKRLATACMRAQRQRAMASQRIMKETVWRAKRLTREMQAHWKKYEREEKQQKKAKEKVASDQRKMDIEILEAKRQQRKLNFLITQTELYAHFMAKKLGEQNEDTESTILSKLNSDIKDVRLQEMDDYDEESVKQKARQTATNAAQKQEAAMALFDSGIEITRPEDTGSLKMSDAAEDAGDRPQPDIFVGKLKSYQLKGMNWLCSLYDQGINGILADEMGLGKTVQSLAFLAHVAETYGVWGPFLVVTPASTLHNWQQEIAKFVPQFKCVPYWGSPQERKVLRGFWTQEDLHTKDASFHIVVTSYQIVITDYKYFNRHAWQYMVLDEAQAIKSASSQRWKMLLEFKCRGRLLLSGTPIQNTMAELWSLLHFVMPNLFDNHEEFKEWFSKDIEGHAEGTKQGKVDEKQMGRLHLILKPFMLRRIKKEVENELTDKVEVLVYCPLTIRQRLLYSGLKQNLKIEDLLAGLGFGNGSLGGIGVTSLMNLVMQFRKVCNHPELFERREPKSPILFNTPTLSLPKLLFLDRPHNYSSQIKFNIFRSDYVQRSLKKTTRVHKNREYLEVSESPYSFLRFLPLTPGELETQSYSLYHKLSYISNQADRFANNQFRWTGSKDDNKIELLLPHSSLPRECTFTSHTSSFLCHSDIRMVSCPETMSHRIIRSRRIVLQENSPAKEDKGTLSLVSEFPHIPREEEIRKTCSTDCPSFLLHLTPKVGALPFLPNISSRAVQYQHEDYRNLWVNHNETGRNLLTHGSLKLYEDSWRITSHYTEPVLGGLEASRPKGLGWSGIVIPEKQSLISDAGKLFVLDKLLARLREDGHRVLIYSQMTRMIDLLEEYMSHRQHSYMRLDGSSKIHERRDMVADFQERQDIFVFLLSTRAGGLGINLTAADTVIFYDSDWNPTVDQQAMDRAHRLGQTRQVTVYRLICKGTIEERILQRAREKSEIHRMVIQGGSFKGKGGDLRPKEVVSLLLDDDEIEKRVKVKLEEEEEKADKEKTVKSKSKKRNIGSDGSRKGNTKKPKIEIEEDESKMDPETLFDFAGDQIGPKKPRGKVGAKRGRPKGTLKDKGREEIKPGKNLPSENYENYENLDICSMDASDSVFGFYNQT